ncbi:hypothetical protein PHLGIDRAFT_325470 [Phlebiopsis gigantea 11061_1 CR5-6]|uniref:BTB domain-containing protein n=1 Tax=Phlebiopsis gigantea (strain 11061_1 CR5-6) TaxID=745531 RepID=A0A0C3RQ75_PHLG1|nr:hypothetical protein PHLGIDRAFT_325470 [Phlebiopsis gigantea 11061_1 CR5-6]
MEVDPELARCTRDPDLWFTDGSVVLRADDALYRVYSGILSQASPVFRAMFGIPQPAYGSESYDGCPLVHMPDSAQDLRPFLRALYDCSQFNVSELTLKDTPMIVSVLRISTKYEVRSLRKRAIDALLLRYPITYNDYITTSWTARPQLDHPRHVLVANIAREADVPILLPTALLACAATANSLTLWDGMTHEGVHYALCEPNKRALFLGRPKLAHIARHKTQAFFFHSHSTAGCKARQRCDEFCRIFADAFDHRDDPWVNPFYRMNWKSVQSACCEPCATSWEQIQTSECDLAWQALPSYFDLPPWHELEKLTYGTES